VGLGRVRVAVADAGPLIHLSEVNCFPLLRIFDTLHIPEAVWSDTVEQGHVPSHDVSELGIVRTRTIVELAIEQIHRYSDHA